MTSIPTVSPSPATPDRPSRRQRGFIASYGVGRVCADLGCRTTLSRYNKSALCYPHADQLEARHHRERS